jgi:hypothetical protein
MRRLFSTVLVVAALALYATPAGAQSVPVDQISIPFDDGEPCTAVPDTIPGVFDFTSACAAHDLCYAGGEQTQAACDNQFLRDMTASCVAQHPAALDPLRYVCLTFAQLYYAGVALFGQFFF